MNPSPAPVVSATFTARVGIATQPFSVASIDPLASQVIAARRTPRRFSNEKESSNLRPGKRNSHSD